MNGHASQGPGVVLRPRADLGLGLRRLGGRAEARGFVALFSRPLHPRRERRRASGLAHLQTERDLGRADRLYLRVRRFGADPRFFRHSDQSIGGVDARRKFPRGQGHLASRAGFRRWPGAGAAVRLRQAISGQVAQTIDQGGPARRRRRRRRSGGDRRRRRQGDGERADPQRNPDGGGARRGARKTRLRRSARPRAHLTAEA